MNTSTDKQLPFFVELHSHILPGIDDGPRHIEQSLKMAGQYAENGFELVVASPHRFDGRGSSTAARIMKQVKKLQRAIEELDLPIEVLAGMEVPIGPDILTDLVRGRILSLGGSRYVMIETPFEQFPLGWEQCLFEIEAGGYSVLLAHPERCRQLQRRPQMLDVLAGRGLYLQVNCESLLGFWGRGVQQCAHRLIAEGRAHCLATDSHDAVQRSPATARAVYDSLAAVYGEQTLVRLLSENPRRVLDSLPLRPVEPSVPSVQPSEIGRAARLWQKTRKLFVG